MDFSALIALGVFIALNFLTSLSGALFKPGAWYQSLAKPGWTPPNWAFPLVWSALYLMNAVSGWLVWQAAGMAALPALCVYLVSLILNAGWSAMFFGLRRMDLGLVNVALLWLSILAVAILFWPYSPIAAALQLPYLLWVSIASALNFTVWRMNRGASASA
ncbi:TspO/MBR family protein [Hyphomonas sp.]|uniref:TspO/MBR family protein n=1 Tax=Hyphomonas sp. TaxID=87 RepID=UPI003918E67D